MKLRGVNLNWSAYNCFANSLNDEVEVNDEPMNDDQLQCRAYEAFKARVLHFGKIGDENEEPCHLDGPVVVPFNQLRGHRYGGIRTIATHKTYRPIITNAQIIGNYRLMPFGY